MHNAFCDLLHTPHCNSISLFDGQWVVRGLQLYERPLTDWASVEVRFEIQGIGITRQRSAEPAEVWRLLFSPTLLP